MYFTDTLRVIARRWWVAVIGLALVGGLSFAALKVVSTQYQASAQVLLLPPAAPVLEGEDINPYLGLPSGLTLTASLVAAAVSTPDVQREMADTGFHSPYAATVVPQTGPLIAVTVKDTDPAAALAMRDEVIRRIDAELDTIQTDEEVTSDQLIETQRFTVSAEAEVLAGARLHAVVLIGAVGMVLTLLAIFGLDRLRRGRGPVAAAVAEDEGTDLPVRLPLREVSANGSTPMVLPTRKPAIDSARAMPRRRLEGRGH